MVSVLLFCSKYGIIAGCYLESCEFASVKLFRKISLCALLLAPLSPEEVLAQDQGEFGRVIRIERSAFLPDAGLITFSEKGMGHKNPLYRPSDYGAKSSSPAVAFGGFFEGQMIGRSHQCPAGAVVTGCVIGNPRSPLRLAGSSPQTFIAEDSSNPRSPSLSGSPRWNGPVTVLFDKDIAGVGLAGGFFNSERSTAIQAYDRNGKLIGGVKNIGLGMEYMALVTEDGRNRIAGLQFSLVGAEAAGFGVDDLSFAFASQIDEKQVPGMMRDSLAKPVPATPENKDPAAAASPKSKDKVGGLSGLFGAKDGEKPPEKPKKSGGLGDLFAD